MTLICPECGAKLNEDISCEEIFNSSLVLEFSDPAYEEVHMLTVACYMIQHGRYSNEALTWIGQKLHAALDDSVQADQIRRLANREADQRVRSWKVTRRPGDPPRPKIPWSMTIIDVAAQYHDAAGYCSLVKQWARTTLNEMKPLIAGR